MEIIKIAAQRRMKIKMPLSFHFYLENNHSKANHKYQTLMGIAPVIQEDKAEEVTFANVVLLQT